MRTWRVAALLWTAAIVASCSDSESPTNNPPPGSGGDAGDSQVGGGGTTTGGDAGVPDGSGAAGEGGSPSGSGTGGAGGTAPLQDGEVCASDDQCLAGHFCECADASCSIQKCNATECTGCWYTAGDGACSEGPLQADLDPHDACDFACDGSGNCQTHDSTTVQLSWDRLFNANYAYNVVTTGSQVVPCKSMGQNLNDTFDGRCTQDGGHNIPLAEVAAFRFYTTMDCWQWNDPACNIGLIEVPYTGQTSIYAHESPVTNCPNLSTPSIPNRRDEVVPLLADPDVFNDDCRLLLSGTNRGANVAIWKSTTALHSGFTELPTRYNPSAKDAQHDYCWIYDASIEKVAGLYVMLFAAVRVNDGVACPGATDPKPHQGFVAFARDDTLDFGKPFEIQFPEGNAAPHSSITGGDPTSIRIGARLYYDDLQQRWWLGYNWFNWGSGISEENRGNWGVAAPVDNPTNILTNTWPVATESNVAEGPEFFRVGSKYYYCFSFNPWFRAYGIKCLRHTRVDRLQRDNPPPPGVVTYDPVGAILPYSPVCHPGNTAPLCGGVRDVPDPSLLGWEDAAGRPSVVNVNGAHFMYYHVLQHVDGDCGDESAGNNDICNRDTYVSRLQFDANDNLFRLNRIDISWNAMGGAQTAYSLDLIRHDNTVVGPCIHAGILGNSTSFRFDGACANGNLYHKGHIKAFRLWVATDGVWNDGNNLSFDVAYDGYRNSVVFDNQ